MRPAEPVQGPPHGRHTQLLALVLRPPDTVLLDGRIRLCFQPREEDSREKRFGYVSVAVDSGTWPWSRCLQFVH